MQADTTARHTAMTATPATGLSKLIGQLGSASLFALVLGMTAAPAIAADADQPAAAKPDDKEIIVTAQFRSQKLQDTPIAITALNAASLEERSVTNLSQATDSAPSVLLRAQSPAFGDSIAASIRGLGQGDFDPALEPGVGVYIDDVYFPRLTGANLELLDVDRIEVLRGPQGTLSGKNAEGGAIKFYSRLPDGSNSGSLAVSYGSRHHITANGTADFTVADGLYGRVSGAYNSQDGYVNVYDFGCQNPGQGLPNTVGGSNCLKFKEGDQNYQALRGMLRYNPNNQLDITLSGDYMHSSHHDGAQVLLYANNPNPNVAINGVPYDSRFICGPFCNYDTFSTPAAPFIAGLIPPFQGFPQQAVTGSDLTVLTSWGVSGTIKYNLSDKVKLTSISSYRAFDNAFSSNNNLSPNPVGFGNDDLTDWAWSQELRVNAELASNVHATLGGYISHEKAVYYTLQDIRYVALNLPAAVCKAIGGLATPSCPIEPLQFIGNDPIVTKNRAVYGNVEFKATDALTINGGLRYSHDEKAYTFARLALDGVTPNAILGALNGVTGTYSGNHTDWRIAVDYRFSPEVLAYASAATGYKAGGVGPRPFNPAQAVGFGPEHVTSYEVGVKTDLLNRKIHFNADVYYLDFKDAQLTLLSCPQFGGPGPCALPQNAGNAHSKGVEVETVLRPFAGFSIDGSLSYQDWKWTCVNPQVVGGGQGACSTDPAVIGKIQQTPPGVFKWKWALGAQYVADLGKAGSLTTRVDADFQGALTGNVLTPAAGSPSALLGQVDGYTLVNARITWRNANKDLDIALAVTNLADKYYFPQKFDLTGAGAGAITGVPGRPREFLVTVKKKF